MPRQGTRKCLHCQTFFKPNPRSKGRQKFCSHPDCQKASKAASQKKWLQKSQNKNYFSGSENVQRVQQWRAKNPGYWKKVQQSSGDDLPLQDALITQATEKQGEIGHLKQDALQELLIGQELVFIGLIAHLTGAVLQDDIVKTGRKLRELGEDFLYNTHLKKGEHNERTSATQSRSATPDPTSVQLDRSPPGT